MNKLLPWILALTLSTTVVAQIVEVDIKPDDLLAGTADETLQQLGARAVAEGMTITITAPAYWKDLIEEQVRVGIGEAPVEISHRETFIESVIVRLHDRSAPAAPAKSPTAPAAASAQRDEPTPPPPESPDTRAAREALRNQSREAARPELAPAEPAGVPRIAPEIRPVDPALVMGAADEPAATEPEEPAVEVQTTSALERDRIHQGEDSVVVEVPGASDVDPIEGVDSFDEVVEEPQVQLEAVPTEPGAVAEQPAGDDATGISAADARASLEQRLNAGRPISKSLSMAQLRRGDQVFTTGDAVAVVRSTRVGRNVYWLDGSFDADDEDVKLIRAGKYEITGRVDRPTSEAPADELVPASPAAVEVAEVAADTSDAERSEMEARYNEGRPIESTITPQELTTDDILYVGDELIVVVRRDRVSLKRYWLSGEIDLTADELEQRGSRKYRVRRRL